MPKTKVKKRKPDYPAPEAEGILDPFTVIELSHTRTLILRYDPVLDIVDVDETGLTLAEVRGIVAQAYDKLF